MKKFIVSENDSGQRVDKFLKKAAPNLPLSMLYKAIRRKDIKIGGRRCQPSDFIRAGDEITVFLPDDVFQKPRDVRFTGAKTDPEIIFEDENIIIAEKPPGLLCHPGENSGFDDNLLYRIQNYLSGRGEYIPEAENTFAPALCNRIDRNTCGLVIAAKNAAALRIINEKLRQRQVRRLYLALVRGVPVPNSGEITAFHTRDKSAKRVHISASPGESSAEIRTKYRVLKISRDYSLLEIELITGRTHQIRAQLAKIGHPLAGERKYSDNPGKFSHQALCAYKITFRFESPAGILEYLNGKSFEAKNIWFQRAVNE